MSLRRPIDRLERRPRELRLDPAVLADVAAFTDVVGTRALRDYQAEAARAIVASIREGRGDIITMMMARQMGKNQTPVALEPYLLHLCSGIGGQIVKAAPTFMPQIVNSKLRIERELWTEVELARYEMRANEQSRWYGPEAEGHADFLLSFALCCQTAVAAAPAEDAVIAPQPISYGD